MVVEAEGFDLAAGTKPLLEDAELVLERGEHVALIGPNGSGKSTLLEAIVGGRLGRIGHGVELAYFSQHEVELDERGSVLECAMGATGLQRSQAQALLGRFLFSGWDDHDKPVVALSGGERRRLALALVVASGANFLVLDEPTNHLDLESREALEAALEAFPGTVLLVSHDRAVLDAVAERIVAVEDGSAPLLRRRLGRLRPDPRRRERAAAATAEGAEGEAAAGAGEAARPSELEQIEASIQARELELAELERQLAEDWGNVETLAAHTAAREELQRPARALGAAVRGRAGLAGGDPPGDDRRVLADADQERRLPLAQEVGAEEEEARHGGARAVVVEREAERVERLAATAARRHSRAGNRDVKIAAPNPRRSTLSGAVASNGSGSGRSASRPCFRKRSASCR